MNYYAFPNNRLWKAAFALFLSAMLFLARDSMYTTAVLGFYKAQFLMLALIVLAGVVFLWVNRRNLGRILTDGRLILAAVLALVVLAPMVLKRDWQLMYFSILLCIFFAVFVSYFLSVQEAAKYYVVILAVLGTYSMIATYILRIGVDAGVYSVPVFQNSIGYTFYNFFGAIVSESYVKTRNFGIFREPGVYQYFLLLALYLNNYTVRWSKNRQMWICNGLLTALFISLWMGPRMIAHLQKLSFGQVVRNDGPESHFSKRGTPTMGGIMILTAIVISVLLWAYPSNPYVWCVLVVLVGYGVIGFVDDYRKVVRKDTKGLIARWKYFWMSVIALGVAFALYLAGKDTPATQLVVPFFKDVMPQLGLFYILLAYFVIVGTGNAVNLTDGLDGLAIMPTVFVAGGFALVAWATGNMNFASYLHIPYLRHAGELVIVCTAIVGAGLGFLWFNTYPAQVFMGDVGSLALGGALGIIAVLLRQEFLLVIMGGVFVVETLSVILQVGSFKLRGQRIFRMAPIHHHYELKGWPEPRVIVRFWIISLMLVLIGLATLKVR